MAYKVDIMIPDAPASNQHIDVRSPYDDALVGSVGLADQNAIDRAMNNALACLHDRENWLKPAKRIEILRKTAELMSEQAEQLAVLAASEGGKPLLDSRVEVARAIDGIEICIETLRTSAGEVIPMGINAASSARLAFTQKEPVGIVLAYSAFNHPINLIVHQVGPAIAAGCPVLVKPANDTPLSCFRFVGILREAGLPESWCQPLLPTELSIAEALVSDPEVGFFSFIGSAKVGWMLRSKLAPGARCALEHGGVAPVIVAADANLDDALPLLAKGGFYHAGQVCVSVQRVFAHRQIARDLTTGLANIGKDLKVGDPTDPNTEVGPLIRPREVERIDEWVTEATTAGSECLTGGKVLANNCYAPTVLYDPPQNAKVSQQEIFGPVICIYPFEDMDSALKKANDLPYAFQASVFTRDIDTAMRAARSLDASAVMINDHTAFRVDWMPFAGLKQSGLGVGGIPHTTADMQIEKMIVLRSNEWT